MCPSLLKGPMKSDSHLINKKKLFSISFFFQFNYDALLKKITPIK